MARFFGTMLRISMESKKMGGRASYFEDNPIVHMGGDYRVRLRRFDPWAKQVMTLIRFKQIRSAFYPKLG